MGIPTFFEIGCAAYIYMGCVFPGCGFVYHVPLVAIVVQWAEVFLLASAGLLFLGLAIFGKNFFVVSLDYCFHVLGAAI